MDTTGSTQQTHEIVGRFAPTPSGRMHLGNAFSALVSWLGARSAGGRIVLRVEDLEARPGSRELAAQLMDDLAWLGLDWDEGPWYQSERSDVYEAAICRLAEKGLTYPCFCTRRELHAASAPHASDGTYVYQGTCRDLTPIEVRWRSQVRPPATRLVVPDQGDEKGQIAFDDLVFGHHAEELWRDCGDFLVRRSDGVFAYQLAVIVDDALMGVTQVVRGRDLLGSTARQIYLQRLLGFAQPTYAHVPLLVAPDGRRLAKRDQDLELGELRARGMRPEELIGRLAAASGLIDAYEPVSATDLLDGFSWERLAEHHDDIVVGPDFLG